MARIVLKDLAVPVREMEKGEMKSVFGGAYDSFLNYDTNILAKAPNGEKDGYNPLTGFNSFGFY